MSDDFGMIAHVTSGSCHSHCNGNISVAVFRRRETNLIQSVAKNICNFMSKLLRYIIINGNFILKCMLNY